MRCAMNKKLFIGLFFVFILLISISFLIIPPKTVSTEENRLLAQFPEVSVENIKNGSFMKQFDEYTSDQIAGRNMFVKLSTYVKLAMGQNDINGVIKQGDTLYAKRDTLNSTELEQVEKNIKYVSQFLRNNSNAYFGLIPTAIDIYDINYPNKLNQKEFIDNVYSTIKNNTIDMYTSLYQHRDEPIYYKTDHHWTTRGAYYGFESIAKLLNMEVPKKNKYEINVLSEKFEGTTQSKLNIFVGYDQIQAWNLDKYNNYTRIVNDMESYDSLYDLEKLSSSEPYAVFLGGNNGKVDLINPNGNGKKILFIKDSYSHCLAPFFLDDYSQVTLIDPRHSGMMGIQSYINQENFDYIIVLYNVENFIASRQLVFLNR